MDRISLWNRYQTYLCDCSSVGLKLDISRINFPSTFFDEMEPALQRTFLAMSQLEAGEISNPDESRMVGHYWLRAPHLAPDDPIRQAIEQTLTDIKSFVSGVHDRTISPPTSAKFTDVLLVGIGGSALGPQLVADSLTSRRDRMKIHFLDNTDPDGIDRCLGRIGTRLKSTLTVVISKSGGTKETRNGMLEVEARFRQRGLNFPPHAVAVTGKGSQLDQYAKQNVWLKTFPMWDWVGGRTSVMSAVGLLPAALQGIDIDRFLAGAEAMDQVTRRAETKENPAVLLALMWYFATEGRGAKDMVILPYKDRLLLLSRYLQQLVMESLGKELDLDGRRVHQGIAVYGNKGSTDQHAYVQQLREGVNNFFATFIVVLRDRVGSTKAPLEVDPGITSGDYLSGFWQGTRRALYEKDRGSITITLDQLDASRLGALIGLYERAVGFYAILTNINAYHQPGVEAGKAAATAVLSVQTRVVEYLKEHPEAVTAEDLARHIGEPEAVETVYHVLEHLAANRRGVVKAGSGFRFKAVNGSSTGSKSNQPAPDLVVSVPV